MSNEFFVAQRGSLLDKILCVLHFLEAQGKPVIPWRMLQGGSYAPQKLVIICRQLASFYRQDTQCFKRCVPPKLVSFSPMLIAFRLCHLLSFCLDSFPSA
jgi:hypothetical protein